MSVAVIPIVRNQAWNVPTLVESVLAEMEREGIQPEVVLVDSASDDGGPAIASTYPIRVLALDDTEPLTAAAGRHVGYLNTTGNYLLFLDGDMELIPGWLAEAVEVLDFDPEIAAVSGKRIDVLPGEPATALVEAAREDVLKSEVSLREIPHGGGAALYRRSALDEVGSFNPFIVSDEEPELCIRLRFQGGYRIVALTSPHVIHYSQPPEEFATLIGRARRRLYVGSGQCIRYLWGTSLLWPYLKERGFGLLPGVVLLLGLMALGVLFAAGNAVPLLLWLGVVASAVALDAARKRSVHQALLSGLRRILHFTGTIRGLWMPAPPASSYRPSVRALR